MTEIEKKALVQAVAAAGRRMQDYNNMAEENPLRQSIEAHARAIEKHEAFRQEVSDAVEDVRDNTTYDVHPKLWRYIRTEPDPLVEVLQEISGEGGYDNFDHYAYRLRSALEARDLEIREKHP